MIAAFAICPRFPAFDEPDTLLRLIIGFPLFITSVWTSYGLLMWRGPDVEALL